MLKMSRGLYTGGNFKQFENIWKKRRKILGPYSRSRFDKLTIWCNLIIYKIYYATTACTTYIFTLEKCWLIEQLWAFKIETYFDFSLYFYCKLCQYRITEKSVLSICLLICSEQFLRKKWVLVSSLFKKIIPYNTTTTFQEVGWVFCWWHMNFLWYRVNHHKNKWFLL